MTSRLGALTAFAAHLSLAAQLMGIVHVLTVRHATCPDHGEVIHASVRAASFAPEERGGGLSAAPVPSSDEGDDHCLMALARNDLPGLTVRPAALTMFSPGAAVISNGAPALLFAASSVLEVAPKTSPPLAV